MQVFRNIEFEGWNEMKLSELGKGMSAKVTKVGGDGPLRHHLINMGIIPGTEITLVKVAPMGDPIEIALRGYSLTLRKAEAEKILIDDVKDAGTDKKREKIIERETVHPRIGEPHIYYTRRDGELIDEDTQIRFALVGNQNCGKTTLFNQLTGSKQHVGNFPGVTVDRVDGIVRNVKNAVVTDLPGIYSMSPYTSEEIVTRDFLLDSRPEGIINIVDATNLERNLYLTMQLLEMDIPMVLALNMMDEVAKNGGTIEVNKLEETLGIPVVPISAIRNEGIDELIEHAVHVARYREVPGRQDFCDYDSKDDGAVHRCMHSIMHLIEDHANKYRLPLRFVASKLIEGDEPIMERLKLSKNEKETIEHLIKQMEIESGMDRVSAVANMRFHFIEETCEETVVKPKESIERARSNAVDKILTGKYTGIPSFILIMGLVFWLTFGLIGKALSDAFESGIESFTETVGMVLSSNGINPVVESLVVDGVFAGVGSVLSFLPTIVTLFFFLSLLEDSGYMARVAFVMDKLLRRVGLSGRSFVPMLIGFGCSVPGIMATRTLPSERDRKMTIMLLSFMSCSAKLPIYALFSAAFFPDHAALMMIGLYFTGIVVAILFALILKNTGFRGEPVPFVMELPVYRLPSAKTVALLIWDKAKGFITKAFTIIFAASIIVWFLQTFDLKMNIANEPADSLLALLGGAIAPLFKPLGFADWRVSTALITGFVAKETVVSTLTVLLGGSAANLSTLFVPFTAIVFLVFILLYTPCVAAIGAVKRELGGKWAFFIALLQCVIAWIVAFIVNVVGSFIGFI